uniref:Integrase_SAM-like_N domain-containing protein n=1 Tax=Loa loa TaxID=7209 RepID=A0A1I7W520_LOALO
MQPYKVHRMLSGFYLLHTKVIGIQEQPNDQDDEKALEQFKNYITKKNNRHQKVITNMDQEGIIHYLPHHEVLTPGKATTKLRIVYDASAHIKGDKSLNNVLYRGPTILPDLAGALLRFCREIVKTAR